MSSAELDDLSIETAGIPGFLGRPAAAIHRPIEPAGFDGAFWISEPSRVEDLYVVFATKISTINDLYRLDIQSSGNFLVKIDGETIINGPIRFACNFPEFYSHQLKLTPGDHWIIILAHGESLKTRTMAPLPNFVWARIMQGSKEVTTRWRAREITEYKATGLRVSPLLGWVEWLDTPITWSLWKPDFSESQWKEVTSVPTLLELTGPLTKSELVTPKLPSIAPKQIASGKFRDSFTGYTFDDLASQFFLADLDPRKDQDFDGEWFRYDLGKIRIGYFQLNIECKNNAIVVIAYGERLTPFGTISPVVPLSTGPTRMIQRFAVAPGISRIEPIQSMGARYVELRIYTKKATAISNENFIERDFIGEPPGFLQTSDELLNQIWRVGIETMRSSAEDAIVDSVRERAEWIGDVATAGAHLLSAAWGDLALLKRAVLHAAASARPDGMVAGSGPGDLMYLGSYASMWIGLTFHVAVAEGSADFLHEFADVARANMKALASLVTPEGMNQWPWPFIDWGYHRNLDNHDSIDPPAILHFIHAIQTWEQWLTIIEREDELSEWTNLRTQLITSVKAELTKTPHQYHSYSLATIFGLLDPSEGASYIEKFLKDGFPYNLRDKRLRAPGELSRDLVTPYFTNYSIPVLLEAGKGDVVADIWRRNWGWMLKQGATTWWEVFDDRWSHCHYWSGAPTWQLSRYGLGLHPTLTANGSKVELRVNSFGLQNLRGRIHLPLTGWVDVEWKMIGDGRMSYSLSNEKLMILSVKGAWQSLSRGTHNFELVNEIDSDIYK